MKISLTAYRSEGRGVNEPDDMVRITVDVRVGRDADRVKAALAGIASAPSQAAAALGRLGGKAKSPAKSASARANGRKGGRPRKEAKVKPEVES